MLVSSAEAQVEASAEGNPFLAPARVSWLVSCPGRARAAWSLARKEKEWLGDRDSNPDRQSQSLQSYR